MIVVLLIGAVAVVLPRVVDSAGFREQAKTAVRDQLGLELDYASIGVGVLPPRVRVVKPRLLAAGGEPDLEAEEIGVHVALMPLFRGALVVDRVQVDGAVFEIVRTSGGMTLRSGVPIPTSSSGTSPEEPEASGDSAITLHRFALSDARVSFEDRTLRPPQRLGIAPLDISANLRDDGIDLEGQGQLSTGGSVELTVRTGGSGDVDAKVQIDGLGVDALGFLVRDYGVTGLGGQLDATLVARVANEAPQAIDLKLALAHGSIVRDGLVVNGPVALETSLTPGEDGSIRGPVSLDLRGAAMDLAGSFHKKPGEPARLDGQAQRGSDGELRFDGKLKLLDLASDVVFRSGKRTSVRFDSNAVELGSWNEAVPALAGFEARGPARLAGLRVFDQANGKYALDGGIELNGVRVKLSERGQPLTLRGMVAGVGPSLRFDGLRAESPGGPVEIEGRVDVLTDEMAYAFDLKTPQAIESGGFIASLSDLSRTLAGPLLMNGSFRGTLAGEASLVETVRGSLDFSVGSEQVKGSLVGVSILKSVVDQFGPLGGAALMAGPLKRGKTLEDYYAEEFDVLAGSFQLGDGRARTQDLRIQYKGYEVLLRGSMGLTGLDLDMVGTIRLSPEIDAKISGGRTRQVRTIPLAQLRGNLAEPKIGVTKEVVGQFASGYVAGALGDALTGLLEKAAQRNQRDTPAVGAAGGAAGTAQGEAGAAGEPPAPGEAAAAPAPVATRPVLEEEIGGLVNDLVGGLLGGKPKPKSEPAPAQ